MSADELPGPALLAHVIAVWQDELALDPVAHDQDFFELGGHSLGAMRVAARLGEELGCDLSLRAVFEHRTAAALAAELTRMGAKQ
ncbi:phosphopantetheine-binding protein [Streptomyces sp. NPDC020807]|uniref:phosphopantetheine-binding protein n=1 Tax=Streptomyces sp. NPDC020807 TaxID=3155119 RepID=UPI0033E45E03